MVKVWMSANNPRFSAGNTDVENRYVHYVTNAAGKYRVGQKKRGHRLVTIILSNLNRFKKKFHWKIPW